jgi:hypothetical protein
MTKGFLNDDFDVPGDITAGGIESTPIGGTTPAAVTGTTGTFDDVDVDNVNINVNTISITDTNGNMLQKANGTGDWKVTTPGDADAIILDSDGILTLPLQSSFLVNNSVQDNNVTGDATVYTIDFDSEIYDQNNDFASDTYTCPVTSRVYLSANIGLAGVTAGHTLYLLTLVTSNRSYFRYQNAGNAQDGGFIHDGIAMITDMDAADTSTWTIQVSGSTKVVDVRNSTWCCGQIVA